MLKRGVAPLGQWSANCVVFFCNNFTFSCLVGWSQTGHQFWTESNNQVRSICLVALKGKPTTLIPVSRLRNSHASFFFARMAFYSSSRFHLYWAFYLEFFAVELSWILEIEVSDKFTLLMIIVLIYSPAETALCFLFLSEDAAPED